MVFPNTKHFNVYYIISNHFKFSPALLRTRDGSQLCTSTFSSRVERHRDENICGTSNRAKEQHGKTVKSADKLTVQVWSRYNC